MKYRRRQRWLRRLALGLSFATVAFAGTVDAFAQPDEGGSGSQVTAGGWSGQVDESGIPVSAGIPSLDEQIKVIPYLSHGILTQAQADALAAKSRPSGDELYIRNAIAERRAQPSTDLLGEMLKSRVVEEPYRPGVTDFPTATPVAASARPDDRTERFSAAQPNVISYLSHGQGNAGGEVGARPDDRADRFSPGDGVTQPTIEVSGSNDWNGLALGIGAVVLALGFGLALGFVSRPRLAGL